MKTPSIEYNDKDDVGYVRVAPGVDGELEAGVSKYQRAVTVPGGTIILDFTEQDALFGIELIGAKTLLGNAVEDADDEA